jgi:hypothetical protein
MYIHVCINMLYINHMHVICYTFMKIYLYTYVLTDNLGYSVSNEGHVSPNKGQVCICLYIYIYEYLYYIYVICNMNVLWIWKYSCIHMYPPTNDSVYSVSPKKGRVLRIQYVIFILLDRFFFDNLLIVILELSSFSLYVSLQSSSSDISKWHH